MATVTISLPDPMLDWIETKVRDGVYTDPSDYVRDLVQRDRERHRHPELTIDDLRRSVDESLASGISKKSVSSILAEAREQARANRRSNG